MREPLATLLLFLGACLAAALVQGASRGNEPRDILREAARGFVTLAGGIALLCAAIWLVVQVAQS
jgi:hypothetical protein